MRVLVATEKPFAAEAVNNIRSIIENAGFELVLLEKYTDKSQLLAAVSDVEAAIVRSDIFDEEVLNAGKKLRIVVRAGAGYDNVNLTAATANNIVVMNTPGQNSNAVAELAIGMALFAFRNQFDGTSGGELYGKKIGIHAFGNVGRNLARIAKGFNMDVFASTRSISAETLAKDGITKVESVAELYKTCQVVSVHVPANEQTKKMVNYDLLIQMPKNAILINTARKEVIDEEGLAKVMEERPDFKYVTDIKPDNHDEMVEKFSKRYFSTPKKMGAQTAEANINAGVAAAKQIVDFLKNGNETFKVN